MPFYSFFWHFLLPTSHSLWNKRREKMLCEIFSSHLLGPHGLRSLWRKMHVICSSAADYLQYPWKFFSYSYQVIKLFIHEKFGSNFHSPNSSKHLQNICWRQFGKEQTYLQKITFTNSFLPSLPLETHTLNMYTQ